MKSVGTIRHQLQQVVFRHVKRQIKENFRKAPETCFHNQACEVSESCDVGICFHLGANGEPRRVVCDSDVLDGMEQAQKCTMWEPLRTKEAIKDEFQALLEGDRGVIASKYPDIAALLWVLDDEDPQEIGNIVREASEEEGTDEQSADGDPTEIPVDGQEQNGAIGAPRDGSTGVGTVSGDEIQGGSALGGDGPGGLDPGGSVPSDPR